MPVERARRLLAAAGDGGVDQRVVREAAQAFIDSTRSADAAQLGEALGILGRAYSLSHSDSQVAALMAAGAVVEGGADAAPLVAPAVDFLRRATPLAIHFCRACARQIPDDADDPREAFQQVAMQERARFPEAGEAWAALDALYMPLIAVLAASPQARAQGRVVADHLAEMREDSTGASWLWPMLMVLDREPILVVEPDTGLGFVGRMSGISSNFQLHVLLMDVFPQSDPPGPVAALAKYVGLNRRRRRVSQRAIDIVRGTIADQGEESITGHWNLHAWTALRESGRLPRDHDPSSTSHWIWNEGVPADIPVFDGYRIVVLGQPSYAREFAAQRDFRALHADIEVERLLSASEVSAWVERFSQHPST